MVLQKVPSVCLLDIGVLVDEDLFSVLLPDHISVFNDVIHLHFLGPLHDRLLVVVLLIFVFLLELLGLCKRF